MSKVCANQQEAAMQQWTTGWRSAADIWLQSGLSDKVTPGLLSP
jgi:hypothetical protein